MDAKLKINGLLSVKFEFIYHLLIAVKHFRNTEECPLMEECGGINVDGSMEECPSCKQNAYQDSGK